MATQALWGRFHYAVRAKGALGPTPLKHLFWIITPLVPAIPYYPGVPEVPYQPATPEVLFQAAIPPRDAVPEVPAVGSYFSPVGIRALTLSAQRGNIIIYT